MLKQTRYGSKQAHHGCRVNRSKVSVWDYNFYEHILSWLSSIVTQLHTRRRTMKTFRMRKTNHVVFDVGIMILSHDFCIQLIII